jgi:serine/threonine protein phosphatase PrpC
MKIRIDKPITFSLTGQRAKNEDYVYPVDEQSRLFIVCDGIGGWDQGEVASRLVAEAVACFFAQNPAVFLSETYLSAALSSAYASLAEYLRQNPFLSRLGTTLALLYLTDAGAVVAHVGDSRVYHLRQGQILHQTQDHKYVFELVAEGIITQEQALCHPRRNTLSRSVGADSQQTRPRMDKAQITHLTDIKEGDYFFLCTDGVFEQVNEATLLLIFARADSSEGIATQMLERCHELTRDNYSGCLVRVNDVSRGNADFPFENSSQNL